MGTWVKSNVHEYMQLVFEMLDWIDSQCKVFLLDELCT